MKISRLLFAALPALLVGCSMMPREDLRWTSLEGAIDPAKDLPQSKFNLLNTDVSVYTVANPAKGSAAPLSIKDLSDHAQQMLVEALIKEAAKPNGTPDDLRKAVLGDKADAMKAGPIKGARLSRTLISTITKGVDVLPGDRLMAAWVLIKPHDFTFSGYTIAATDVTTFNVAHLQDQTTTSLAATGSLAFHAPGPNLSATDSITNQKIASTDIVQQYTKTSIDILGDEMRIYRESERNLDVAGNNLISLTLDVKADSLHGAWRVSNMEIGKPGGWSGGTKATFDVVEAVLPKRCDLFATVTLISVMRHVSDDTRRNYDESKQTVSITRDVRAPHRFLMVPNDEVHPLTYKIYQAHSKAALEAVDLLDIHKDLEFTSYDDAVKFAAFVNANHLTITSAGFKLGKTGITIVSGVHNTAVTGPFFAQADATPPQCEDNGASSPTLPPP